MYCGRSRTAWIGAILALYMVFLLPACWFGGMIRAVELGLPTPNSSNNNEEREEHEPAEVSVRDAQGVRPPPPVFQATAKPVMARVDVPAPRKLASVAHPSLPSTLSVRRML